MTDAIRLQPRTLKPHNTVALPGSKSISNRTLLLAALSDNECDIHSLLKSDDTDRMLEALTQLGVPLEQRAGSLHVVGQNGRFPHTEADLFLGNAGTAFRPLTAALAVLGGEYRLHGVARMHERPHGTTRRPAPSPSKATCPANSSPRCLWRCRSPATHGKSKSKANSFPSRISTSP